MLSSRMVAAATLAIGVVLTVFGFAMDGFNSITWAGFIGAGIALTVHGGLATVMLSLYGKKSERVGD